VMKSAWTRWLCSGAKMEPNTVRSLKGGRKGGGGSDRRMIRDLLRLNLQMTVVSTLLKPGALAIRSSPPAFQFTGTFLPPALFFVPPFCERLGAARGVRGSRWLAGWLSVGAAWTCPPE